MKKQIKTRFTKVLTSLLLVGSLVPASASAKEVSKPVVLKLQKIKKANTTVKPKATVTKPVTVTGVKTLAEFKVEFKKQLKQMNKNFEIALAPGFLKNNKVDKFFVLDIDSELRDSGFFVLTIVEYSYNFDVINNKVVFTFDYDGTDAEEKALNNFAEKTAKEINSVAKTDEEKVIMVSQAINKVATYSFDTVGSPYEAHTIVTEGKGVCQAFTLVGNIIFEKLNIESLFVGGLSPNKGDHAWNMVKVNNQWYHFDITWNHQSLSTSQELKAKGYTWDEKLYPKTENLTSK